MKIHILSHVKNIFYAVALLMFTASAFAQSMGVVPGPNLIKNSSFALGSANWHATATAGTISDISHTGRSSLFVENADDKTAVSFEQILDVTPGQKLYFSTWVKGEDVKGPGAGIKIESYKDAQYLDGLLPVNRKGTFGWTQVMGEFIVPTDATKTVVSVYLQKYLSSGTTGKVWFDDVEVRSIPFEVIPTRPNYRGIVKQGDNTAWNIRINVYPEPQWKAALNIHSTLSDAAGKVLLQNKQSLKSSRIIEIEPPRNLPAGKYTLQQRILDPNGKERFSRDETINIVQEMPRVYLDEQGFTVADGKRFFPMGLYTSAPAKEDLERISQGGFNTVLSYSWNPKNPNPEEYLELAAQNNLKVIYSVKDLYPKLDGTRTEAFNWARGIIKRIHDKPALLAWYTNDEFAPGAGWLPHLKEMYNLVQENDPLQHPTFQAQNKYASLPYEFDITDILAMDLYPIGWPGDDFKLGITSAETRRTTKYMHGTKGTWTVPQIFDWVVYGYQPESKPPTLDEMRNQSYQAIINGATGLIYYSYFDLWSNDKTRGKEQENFDKRWPDVTAMAKEINAITPIVLNGKRVNLDLPSNRQKILGELQDGNQQLFDMSSKLFQPQIEVGAFQDGNYLFLLMANPAYEQSSISFKLPEGWKITEASQGQIKSTFAGEKATFTLPSVGSGVFRLVKN